MSAIEPCTAVLTAEGIERLGADATPPMRARTAATVAALFVEGVLNERERHYAAGILEILARDLEVQVREALSNHVKHCGLLPRSIAIKLARDVDSVALPILRYSSVLNESDLLEIARASGTAKQIAVAQRDNLPSAVSGALLDTHYDRVVGTLLENKTSHIDEAAYEYILGRFAEDPNIQALMVERPALPAMIVARMILRVGNALRQRLIERFGLPESIAEELTIQARDSALTTSIGPSLTGESLDSMAQRLLKDGALTPVFMLRALCTGRIRMFTAGMAARAGISVGNADQLIRDGGKRGLAAVYAHTNLPGDLFTAFRIALTVVQEKIAAGPAAWSEADTQRIISQLVVAYDDLAPGHLESVLSQFARRCANSAHAA